MERNCVFGSIMIINIDINSLQKSNIVYSVCQVFVKPKRSNYYNRRLKGQWKLFEGLGLFDYYKTIVMIHVINLLSINTYSLLLKSVLF